MNTSQLELGVVCVDFRENGAGHVEHLERRLEVVFLVLFCWLLVLFISGGPTLILWLLFFFLEVSAKVEIGVLADAATATAGRAAA